MLGVIAMPLRLVIVDNNPEFLTAARDLLEREGIEIVGVAASGAEAIELDERLRPDLTLLDIDLGPENGLEIADRLSDEGRGRQSSVVLISAYPENDIIELIEASPALGFLPKSELSAASIERLLGDQR
jgi:CheY-like chemotaxis protein